MDLNSLLRRLIWPALLSYSLYSCVDPTSAGLDLLSEDLLNLEYVDTFTVETATELSEAVRTHTPNSFLKAYILGRADDPLFGLSEASLYAQLIPEYLSPKFGEVIVDSVVLVLPYDTSKFYGNRTQPVSLEVYQLLDPIVSTEAHFSTERFMYSPIPLGRTTFFPSKDSVRVFDYGSGTRDTISFPHVRISLSKTLGQELLALDTSYYATDSIFQTFFRGIFIKPSAASSGALVGVNLNTTRAGMMVYYRNDTIQKQFQYQFSPYVANVSTFQHNTSGKPVEKQIGTPSAQNQYIFVQGMGGVNGKIRFPSVASLKNSIVNHAILELRVATLPGDDSNLYPPASTLVLYYRDKNGNLQVVKDVALADTEIPQKFGGTFQAGADPEPGLYRMNLSAHLQDMANGKVSNEMLLSLFPKTENNSRAVLYGAGGAAYRAKLKVAFTKYK